MLRIIGFGLLGLLVVAMVGRVWLSAAQAQTVPGAATPAHGDVTELGIHDTDIGSGPVATPGHHVLVHYTGWLYDPSAPNFHGAKFDSSLDRGEPLEFQLGTRRVIPGWDQGLVGMKVGGHRTLIIPSALAYGARGAGHDIPPNAALVFDVELVGVH